MPLVYRGKTLSNICLDDQMVCISTNSERNIINRGSYMSAHVLLNLLNELRKRDKMRGVPSILSFFRNEFNKFKFRSTNDRFYLSHYINID